MDQAVAGHVLDQFATHLDDLARGQHRFQAANVVLGDAILDRPRPACAFGDVAADGAGIEAGRIGRVEQALGFHGAMDVASNHARLHGDHQILAVDLQDAIHFFR